MSNVKCQLKSQCLMSNFVFYNLDFGIDLAFGSWNLSLNTLSFLIPVSEIEPAYGDPNDRRSQGRLWGNISVDKLAEKMLWCARNPEQGKVMGNWARKHVAEKYSWTKMVDTLYKEMGL